MDSSLILSDILDSSVLFFFIGAIAVFLKSELEIPFFLLKKFSLYLLLSIGLKGGHEIHKSGIDISIAITLIAAIVIKSIVSISSSLIC